MKKSSMAIAALLGALAAVPATSVAYADNTHTQQMACSGCKGDSGCKGCKGCEGCSGCSGCNGCSGH